MAHISKHDLKKNELADFLVLAADWIKNNLTLFYGIAGTAAGIVLIYVFVQFRMSSLNESAAEKLAIAQSMLYQGQTAQGLALLDELINAYSKSDTACKARMTKADYLMAAGKFAEAEQALLPVTLNGKPVLIIPLALSSLGAAQENQGKFAEAAKTYNDFLNAFPDHFFAPKMYESLARVYELTNAPAEARGVYEKLVTLYPSTPWAQRAQERLASIQTQNPSQNPEQNSPKKLP